MVWWVKETSLLDISVTHPIYMIGKNDNNHSEGYIFMSSSL